MSDILYDFAKSQTNSVEYKYPSGIWPVYTGDYEVREHSNSITGSLGPSRYVETPYFPDDNSAVPVRNPGHEASHHESSEQRSPTLWVYSPLREPGLFIEFARLFDPRDPRGRPITSEEQAAPIVEDWVERHGVLGEYAPYPTTNGEQAWQRCNHRQSVYRFVYHAVRAGRCLRLLEAAKAPGGPDVGKIREMGMLGVRDDTPAQLAESAERRVD